MDSSAPTQLIQTRYDRNSCDIGIVHLGYGAFHRAHQAVFIDDYMEATGDMRWGIAAVNLRAADSAAFRDAAKADDGYMLKTTSPDGACEFRLVRSHLKFVDAATQADEAYDLLAQPHVSAVTITVTESGYYTKSDGSLDLEAEPVASDLAGGTSETVYAYLTEALERRARIIGAPIAVVCCDNIRGNGPMLEGALLAYLDAKNMTELGHWVGKNVTFPSSMVDRITPRSTAALQEEVSSKFPDHGTAPVHAEAYLQWVLEDNFASAMPDLSRVGVETVSNVTPYEEAKIRILNGGHSGVTYLGALAGYRTFDQAMRDAELRDHFYRWERDNVLIGLNGDVPFDTSAYLDNVARRFENRAISDPLERICMDGYSKMKIFVRPTLEACLSRGITPEAGFDCVASWVVYARRSKEGRCDIPYHEPFWDKLEPLIAPGNETGIASDTQLWEDVPQKFEEFVPGLVKAIHRMDQRKWQT